MAKKRKNKLKCFIVSPIGNAGEDKRTRADWVVENLIRPALKPLGFAEEDVQRADHIFPVGSITDAMITALCKADLVVVNLDGLNGNVLFEFGVREAWCLPLIPVAPDETSLLFDIQDITVIRFPLKEKPTDKPTPEEAAKLEDAIRALREQAQKVQDGEDEKIGYYLSALKSVGQQFCLDAVYEAKAHTVANLAEALLGIQNEMNSDPQLKKSVPEGRKPLSEHANSLENRLKEFDTQLKSYRLIVEMSLSAREADRGSKNICNAMQGLITLGTKLAERVKMVENTPGNIRMARKKLSQLIESCQDVRAQIEAHRNRSTKS